LKEEILNKGLDHLRQDHNMIKLINEFEKPKFKKINNNFNSLCKIIIYQQLSGKAAKTIYNRFLELFNNKSPIAKEVVKIDTPTLRYIGISKQKSNYIIGLANYFFREGDRIDFNALSDTEIGNELIKLKGIGQWTIDMFLMFTLYRTDILPVGDLGIQKGIKKLFNMKNLPSNKYMIEKSKPWMPYRTIACCYLWRIVDDENTW
jgi:DNA-3-methyladenine glycosylase II